MKNVPELQVAVRALLNLAEVAEASRLLHLDSDARAALLMLIDSAQSDGVEFESAEFGIMVGYIDG